ncbi:MAG: VRR-NUC domain-containing protein [Clostridium sp.]|nr:VRR-NUC domain-containing protein [Clostridium sp.]
MKESEIVKRILDYLRTVPECFCWKEHGGMYGTAGIPDVICCYRGGFYGFEVKTETGRATGLQQATIRKIRDAGGIAWIVRSVDEVRAVINSSWQ